MKRWLGLVLCCAIVGIAPQAFAGEILGYGDFEAGGTLGEEPTGWRDWGGNYGDIKLSDSTVHGGSYSGWLEINGDSSTSGNGVYDIALEDGQTYEAGYWVNVPVGSEVTWVGFRDGGYGFLPTTGLYDSIANLGVAADGNWYQLGPADTAAWDRSAGINYFYLYNWGGSTTAGDGCLFDDVSVFLPGSTATSGTENWALYE